MDDTGLLKNLVSNMSDMPSIFAKSVIGLLVFVNVMRLLGVMDILKWLMIRITTGKKPSSTAYNFSSQNKDMSLSLYSEIFTNHVTFNNRLTKSESDLQELRIECLRLDNAIKPNIASDSVSTMLTALETDTTVQLDELYSIKRRLEEIIDKLEGR